MKKHTTSSTQKQEDRQAERQARIAETTQKLLDLFRSGQAPATIARSVIRRKAGDLSRPSDSWSLSNQILMVISGTQDARGYQQWQEVGRHVKKGAKAVYILAPCTKTFTDKDPETGEEVKKTIITGFRFIPVFRYEDTEGEPLRVVDYTPAELPPLYDVAVRLGISVRWAAYGGREYGYCTTDGKNIVLKSEDVSVFFHELAHAAHGRFKKQKGGQHRDQETVAEMTAAVLCEMYGYREYIGNCWSYIRAYNDRDPEQALRGIMGVLADVEKCLELILGTAAEIEGDRAAA